MVSTAAGRLRSSRTLRIGVALGLGMTARAIANRAISESTSRSGRLGPGPAYREQPIQKAPGRLSPQQLHAASLAYARHMDRVVPLLEERLHAPLPGVVERHAVVSRAEWALANMGTFKALIAHLEPHLSPTGGRRERWRRRSGGHQPAADHGSGRVPAGLPGVTRAGPVRRGAPVRRAGTRPTAVRGGEHPRQRPCAQGAHRPVPALGRPPRDDACLRAGGASLAASVSPEPS